MKETNNEQNSVIFQIEEVLNKMSNQVGFLIRNKKLINQLDLDLLMENTRKLYDTLCSVKCNMDVDSIPMEVQEFRNSGDEEFVAEDELENEELESDEIEDEYEEFESDFEDDIEEDLEDEFRNSGVQEFRGMETEEYEDVDELEDEEMEGDEIEDEYEEFESDFEEDIEEDLEEDFCASETQEFKDMETEELEGYEDEDEVDEQELDDSKSSELEDSVPQEAEDSGIRAYKKVYTIEPHTLGDKLEAAEDTSLAARLQRKPVADLAAAIGINDKFLLLNELFGGSMEKYNKSIRALNNFSTLLGAKTYMSELQIEFQWDCESDAYKKLDNLVERRFM